MTPNEPYQAETPEQVTKHKVGRRTVRTVSQAIGSAVVVGAVTEITGWVPGPNTALIIGALGTGAVAYAQNKIEGWTGRTLPGPLADGVHRQLGDPVVGIENIRPTNTSSWDGSDGGAGPDA